MTCISRAKLSAVDRFIDVLKKRLPVLCAEIGDEEFVYLPPPTAYYFVRSEEQIKSMPVNDEVACFVVVKSPRGRDTSLSIVGSSRSEFGSLSLGVVLTFLHAGGHVERWGRDLTQQEITLLRTELYSRAIIETLYTHAKQKDGDTHKLELTRDDNAIDLSTEQSPQSGTVTTEWLIQQHVTIPMDKFEV